MKRSLVLSHPFRLPLFFFLALFALSAAACGSDAVEVVSGAVDETPVDESPADEEEVDGMIDDDEPVASDAPTVGDAATPEPTLGGPAPTGAQDVAIDADGTQWQVVPQRNDLTGTATHPILDLVVMDETHIGVRFEAIAEGCSGAEAFADESDTEVRIELFVGLPPEAMVTTCMAVQVPKQIVVELAAPLGDRTLVASNSAPVSDDGAVTPELTLEDYIGLTEDAAFAKAEVSGRPARVVMVNGESLITTDDYIARRLNLEIVDNIVTGLKTDAGELAGNFTGF